MPAADVLLYAGDFTLFSKSLEMIIDFNDWLGELPYRDRIVIPGNHEYFLEADPARRSLLSNATVLINESVELEGLNVYGSPVTASFGSAYAVSSPADRRRLYATIPDNTDILLTHTPAYSVLDCKPSDDHHAGCPELLEAMGRIKPKLHVCGHIHGGHGITERNGTLHVNAAMAGAYGSLEHAPILVRIPRARAEGQTGRNTGC